MIRIQVALSGGDTDRDGIPDDVETANGLNPNDPTDGFADPGNDGLTNKQELIDFGTNIRVADTDSDGIADGEEVVAGADGFVTDPLLADTDGDGTNDGREVQCGIDPNNPSDRGRKLVSIEVNSPAFTIHANTILLTEAYWQLTVTGHLANNCDTVDLTPITQAHKGRFFFQAAIDTVFQRTPPLRRLFPPSCPRRRASRPFMPLLAGFLDSRFRGHDDHTLCLAKKPTPESITQGTNYTSSDLTKCNFGAEDGRVFAAEEGTCTITATNSGFSATANGTVTTFAPTPLTFISIPGATNNVDVNGNFAYVAAGAAGLQVVDVSNYSAPVIAGSVDTPGNANDVVVVGSTAFVADGPQGLRIIDLTDPHRQG